MGSPEVIITIFCVGFVLFFALLFGMLLLMRWFSHKEQLAMIEQGLIPADAARLRNGKATLAWGVGVSAFGLVLLGGLAPLGFLLTASRAGSTRAMAFWPVLLPGLVVLFMGLALIIIYFVTRPAPDEERAGGLAPPATPEELPDLPAPEKVQEDSKAPEA
ncbi:MAG: hypothetical protein JSV36_15030 [Anaerolineae bacterium]|nr:MAG: hypothetical protein JSV36_15030 [Anaerolineae bacterium]